VKLYLDEDVNINLAMRLRNYGYNVVTTLEVGNLGNSDEEI
jgi:predicted nuclease of predicted toxin-antitoxin system